MIHWLERVHISESDWNIENFGKSDVFKINNYKKITYFIFLPH